MQTRINENIKQQLLGIYKYKSLRVQKAKKTQMYCENTNEKHLYFHINV